MKEKPFTVNLCTFMGREYNIKILLPYVEKALEINAIDRYYMIDMTRKMSDHKLIHAMQKKLSIKYPDRVFIVNGEKQKKLLQSGKEIAGGDWSPFYSFLNTFKDNDIIIKCDDDTMFIDVETLKAAAEFRWENQAPFLMHSNTINNGVCAYHQQKKGIWKFKGAERMDKYPSAGLTGPTFYDLGETALKMHGQFSKDLKANPDHIDRYKLGENIYFSQRVSINFIFMLGKDRHELKKISTQDEYLTSSKLPQKLDRPNMIIGDFVTAHHSYGRQEELLEEYNSIKFYQELRDNYFNKKKTFPFGRFAAEVSHKPINAEPINPTSPIKYGDKYLFGGWWGENSRAIKNTKNNEYLCIEGEETEQFIWKIPGDPSSKVSTGSFHLKGKLGFSEKVRTIFEIENGSVRSQAVILKALPPKEGSKRYNTYLIGQFFQKLGGYKENIISLEKCKEGVRVKDQHGRYLIHKKGKESTTFYFQMIDDRFTHDHADVWNFEQIPNPNSVLTMRVLRPDLNAFENDPTYAEALIEDAPDMHNDTGFHWMLKNYLWEFIRQGDGHRIKIINDEESPRFLSLQNGEIKMGNKPYKWHIKDGKIVNPQDNLEVTLTDKPSLSKEGAKFQLHF